MENQCDLKEINIKIKRGFLDRQERLLIINPEFFQFENKDLVVDPHTRFDKNQITDYRFGINWIRGFEFTIGREFQIFVRNFDKQVVKINFRSLYGIRRNELHKLYSDIIKALWKFYFDDIKSELLLNYKNDETIEINQVQISKRGVTIRTNEIFKGQDKTITWDDLGVSLYETYFAIYSKKDAVDINRGYSYLKDWNSGVLYSVLSSIVNGKS